MSSQVSASNDLPMDVEDALARLASPEWAATKAAVLADGSRVVRLDPRPDGGVTVAVSRELPSGGPGMLDRFLPKDGRVVQTDDWDPPAGGARTGRWKVEIPGAPASLGGTMRLEPVAGGSRYTIEGDVSVRVPLIGGKAERLISDLVVRLADKEADLLRTAPPAA